MSNPIKHHQDLIVWQRGVDLVVEVYSATERWSTSEKFGLTNQIRRAAVSIPSNVAEGHGRGGDREFSRFLSIARGSLREVETHLVIAHRLKFLSESEFDRATAKCDELGRLLQGLSRRLQPE